VLLDLLQDRQLVDRIFTVTMDNATNNDILVRGLQDVDMKPRDPSGLADHQL
jgi:hypothetical protein